MLIYKLFAKLSPYEIKLIFLVLHWFKRYVPPLKAILKTSSSIISSTKKKCQNEKNNTLFNSTDAAQWMFYKFSCFLEIWSKDSWIQRNMQKLAINREFFLGGKKKQESSRKQIFSKNLKLRSEVLLKYFKSSIYFQILKALLMYKSIWFVSSKKKIIFTLRIKFSFNCFSHLKHLF